MLAYFWFLVKKPFALVFPSREAEKAYVVCVILFGALFHIYLNVDIDFSLEIWQVREYIDDTEDYVNIQLDNQRNELIQLQLTLTIASFGIATNTYIAGAFAMNIPSSLYTTDGSLFWPFVGGTSSGCFVIFIVLLGYAWWKKLLGPWTWSEGKP